MSKRKTKSKNQPIKSEPKKGSLKLGYSEGYIIMLVIVALPWALADGLACLTYFWGMSIATNVDLDAIAFFTLLSVACAFGIYAFAVCKTIFEPEQIRSTNMLGVTKEYHYQDIDHITVEADGSITFYGANDQYLFKIGRLVEHKELAVEYLTSQGVDIR